MEKHNPTPEDYRRQAEELKSLQVLTHSQNELVESLTRSNQDLESRHTAMATELRECKELNEGLAEDNAIHEDNYVRINNQCIDSLRQSLSFQDQNQALESQRAAMEADRDRFRGLNADLAGRYQQIARNHRELNEHCNELVRVHRKNMEDYQRIEEKFQAEQAQLTDQIRRLETGAALSAERIRQFQEKEREAEANPRSFYSGEYLRLSGINAQLELEKSNDEKTKRRLTSEVGRQELMVKQQTEKARTCTERVGRLEESLTGTHKEMARLLEENTAFKASVAEYNKLLQDQREYTAARVGKFDELFKKERDERVGLVSQIHQLDSQILALQASNSSLVAENRDLKEDTRPLAKTGARRK